jgi:hypothetical protein
MNIQKQIESTLSRSVCGGWDRTFLESILEQLSKGKEFSVKQKQTLGKVLARNTEEEQKTHETWSETYAKEYKLDAIVLANYHSRQPYYRPMAAQILDGGVPERARFLRMYNNKYSKKVLVEYAKDAKYTKGNYVCPRSNFNSHKNVELDVEWANKRAAINKFMKRGGFIVKVENEIYSYAKGSKRYGILPVGEVQVLIVEERFLKMARKARK